MTKEELKVEAKKLGYMVVKKPSHQCSCYMPYPNELHKGKNGKWKCVDKYRPIKFVCKHGPTTKCVRLEPQESNESSTMEKTIYEAAWQKSRNHGRSETLEQSHVQKGV